jgi:simple sugar transport system permease protein
VIFSYLSILIAVAVFAGVRFLFYKRPLGLLRRASGKVRYTAVLLSGLLAGLAGACIVLTQGSGFTANTVNGRGFIALAAVTLGRGAPAGTLVFSLLLGIFSSLAVNALGAETASIPPEIFNMLPFLITLITLVVFAGKIKKTQSRRIEGMKTRPENSAPRS